MPSLLPPNASELEKALDLSAQSRFDGIERVIRTVWNPQTCPASMLPWLAWAFSVDVWNDTWTEQRKRQTIAAAFEVHKYKGTIGAVKSALNALGYDSNLVEWFEEAETPFTFAVDIIIEQTGILLPDYNDISNAVNAAKNARSILREIRVFNTQQVNLAAKATTQCAIVAQINPQES